MIDILYYTIIFILILNLLITLILEILNLKSNSDTLPELISDVYVPLNYSKQKQYENEKVKFSIFETVFGSIITILFFAFGGFGYLQSIVASFVANQIVQTLLFFGSLGLATFLISIPFGYYDKFVIEEKFGFNKSTKKLFVIDLLKTILLTAVLGGIVLYVITWLYLINPKIFWITALAVIIVFSLLMNALYSTIILPLFNKKTPLPDGTLKQKVVDFAESIGFSINHIYLIDGSKRTTKANAFFTGFGNKKRVFLYDNLTQNLSEDEIVAVLAHELGHYKKHHILINLFLGTAQSAILLYLFSLISESILFTEVMGGSSNAAIFYLNILCFVLLFEPFQLIMSIFMNVLSRKMEYEADRYTNIYGLGQYLISALKKISSLNYSNLTPHRLYVFVNYSHPPLLSRIKAIIEDSTSKAK